MNFDKESKSEEKKFFFFLAGGGGGGVVGERERIRGKGDSNRKKENTKKQ